MGLRADRPLCFTRDYSALVEETDPRAAFLAYPEGRFISDGDVETYGLSAKNGRVLLAGSPPPVSKDVAESATKAVADAATKEVPEWTLKTSPAEYLERYGDNATNSALARAVLEAEG